MALPTEDTCDWPRQMSLCCPISVGLKLASKFRGDVPLLKGSLRVRHIILPRSLIFVGRVWTSKRPLPSVFFLGGSPHSSGDTQNCQGTHPFIGGVILHFLGQQEFKLLVFPLVSRPITPGSFGSERLAKDLGPECGKNTKKHAKNGAGDQSDCPAFSSSADKFTEGSLTSPIMWRPCRFHGKGVSCSVPTLWTFKRGSPLL